MQSLADRQRAFGAAILDATHPVPPGLVGPDGEESARRFAVYRNNVIAGLIETLRDAYPVVYRLVGEEFFRAMAALYASKDPPRSPILLDYGSGFSAFLDRFEPVAALPYIGDVARIERAWVEAYHSPEAEGRDPTELAHIAPDSFSGLCFTLHPSLRVVRSSLPALTIWRTNLPGESAIPVDLSAGGEDALIVRPDAEVAVHLLPLGGAAFLRALSAGENVTNAATAGCTASAAFDLSENLAGLMQTGAITGWYSPRNLARLIDQTPVTF